MARLEHIAYQPHRAKVDGGRVEWVPSGSGVKIDGLPQIFWRDGQPWNEANLWALELAQSGDVKIETVKSLFEHLHKYANYLEEASVDWRHFPQKKSERVLVRFRGALINARNHGVLSPSTTTARMRAVIRYYRFCDAHGFISRDAPKWKDRTVAIRYSDAVGFERTLHKITTDISIPNRARPGITLEDGLLPITTEHMRNLLCFTKENASRELDLILTTGFFTGARLGTITTLRIHSIEQATRDPMVPSMWKIPVGPGTGIATKFDVSGDLLIIDELMILIKKYAFSNQRIDRVIKATKEHKSFLFLTRQGKPFKPRTVDRHMVELRRNATENNLKFMQWFKFHQTRATFGTWLMSVCLEAGSVKNAIEFVKRAMHHKDESTTFRYVTFIEHTPLKIKYSNAYTEMFLGIASRQKDQCL